MDELREFLQASKEIYQLMNTTLTEQEKKDFVELKIFWEQYYGSKMINILEVYGLNMNAMNIRTNQMSSSIGFINSMYCLHDTSSIIRSSGFETYGYKPIENEVGSVFLPSILMAIRKDTSNKESAKMFLQTMLGRETQTNLLSGLSVIESIFSEILEAEEDTTEPISYMGMSEIGRAHV